MAPSNSLPSFDERGLLPPGFHVCSADDFLERFCSGSPARQAFEVALVHVFDYAKARNVAFILVGGSFITSKPRPGDVDIVLVFSKREFIPPKTERIVIEGARLDIMFCSEDERDFVQAFMLLLSTDQHGAQRGVIAIDLYGHGVEWKITHPPDEETVEIIKRAYIDREIVDLNEPAGVLVTVHGLSTRADWNAEIAPVASSQGWVFAPFVYDGGDHSTLFNAASRRTIVDRFREWIFNVHELYGHKISLIAHSFGTYIVAAYMTGFDIPPVTFNCLILSGSILNEDFDWEACRGVKVNRVLNEIAPNDQWVSWMPKGNWLTGEPLFGRSGVHGFSKASEILVQRESNIFDHYNMIKRDVIVQRWMPFLNANRDTMWKEQLKYARDRFSKPSTKA